VTYFYQTEHKTHELVVRRLMPCPIFGLIDLYSHKPTLP
jgi:hypothetical protein